MLDAVRDIVHLTSGARPDARHDRFSRLALERSFEIVSEASRHLPEDLKARHDNIPWRLVADVGNVLRHGYDSIELGVLFTIARDDIPALEQVCLAELRSTEQPPPPRA